MAQLKSITAAALQEAKKAGFRVKAPKKPGKSANVGTLERYITRYNEWIDKANAARAKAKKRETLVKQVYK